MQPAGAETRRRILHISLDGIAVGFTFNSSSKLTLGASVDLDGDLNHGFGWERDNASYALFDGGFGRLQILW